MHPRLGTVLTLICIVMGHTVEAADCPATPRTGCRAPFVASSGLLRLQDTTPGVAAKTDKLTWNWLKGAATAKSDFGSPLDSTGYDFCVYDETAGTPAMVLSAHLGAGALCGTRACWKESTKGFKYTDSKMQNGAITSLALQEGADGKAKITLTGKGTNLGMPALPLQQENTVTAQLSNGTTCWEARYSTSTRNDASEFKAASDRRSKIYATFVSHNEESANYVCSRQQSAYLDNRGRTLDFARMVVDREAAWDLQTEWTWLQAVQQWDSADVMRDTKNKNIVQYLAELKPDRVAIEAHAHETQYNYADVVHLIEQLGAARTGVVGGFIYYPLSDEVWTRLEQPLVGSVYPETIWNAEILWGAATFNHQGPDSHASGIWRPRDAAHFHEDDPNQRLVNVGGYTGGQDGLDDLLSRLHAGTLEPGRMYTVSIFFEQCNLTDELLQTYTTVVDGHAADVAAGDLVWTTLSEMARIWREDYGSAPVILQADAESPSGTTCGTVTCQAGTVCCSAPLPCAGRCVSDCRAAGATCPAAAPHCDTNTGLCGS